MPAVLYRRCAHRLVARTILPSQRRSRLPTSSSLYYYTFTTTSTSTTSMGKNTDSINDSNNNSNNNSRRRKTYELPSTLQGPPISALVPPGHCQFGPEPTPVTLLQRFPVSETSAVLRFALPDTTQPLNLSTCACLLAQAEMEDGQVVTRPYTPISTNQMIGSFDLLVKNYGPTAQLSRRMHELVPGGGHDDNDHDRRIRFWHIPVNVKIPAEDFIHGQYDHIGMLAGGTGITPMIQALHATLGASTNTNTLRPKVTLLYGSKTADDILGQELLHQWSHDFANRFQWVPILSHEPEHSDWTGERGVIDQDRIAQYIPPASSSSLQQLIMVCGPPPMYDALCGPRPEHDTVSGVLAELGYTAEQVYKF